MMRRLNAIELQGVKTFATLTRLEFPGQITAIVGPNGSGKSNIADGVRWVLGEQSYSLLRAKRTEDMIFSGSQQKSRSGMAMATITFNNEDGWLPIDYSEVSISHRAYRDGQNEYLLNGQKVRLKDISELLSQTGLAERTYTIIGQGLVDVALALSPDERRKLFEEAAGIGLYRSRKEEALRRLESTRKNLDRILDIMSEIKPRLRSLERQANRFAEYEVVRSNLQDLLKQWYGFHWQQKQEDVRNSRNAYRDCENNLSALRTKNSEIKTKVDEAREEMQRTRKLLEVAHGELSEAHRTLETYTRELAIIDERKRSYHQQKSNLEIDLANIEEEIKALESQKQSFEQENQDRQTEFDLAVSEVQRIENQLLNVTQQKESVESQLEETRRDRIALETKSVQVSARIDELGNRMASLNKEQNKVKDALQRIDDEIVILQESLNSLDQAYQEKETACQTLQDQLDKISQNLEERSKEKQTLDQSIAEQETKRAKLVAQLDVLDQAEAALQGYSEGSKKLVENSRKGRLPKGVEPLSKFIVVEEKFEKAISSALGEMTDLLIVPSDGKDFIIEYLESNDNERVALVSLDQVHAKKKTKSTSLTEGVFGYANEFIKVTPQYRALVDQLFSNTIIVKDKLIAQEIQASLAGHERIVTLGGLVFQPNGVVISGQNASGKRIGRTRHQSEMKEALKQLDTIISSFISKKENLAETAQQLGDEHEALFQKIDGLTEEKNKALQARQKANDSLTRLNEQLTWHKDQFTRIQQSLQETQAATQSGKEELSNLTDQIGILRSLEQEKLKALEALPLFELQQERNHWQTHRIVLQNALGNARQRYLDHQKRIEESEGRLLTFQNRVRELESNLSEITEKEINLKEDAKTITLAIEKIKTGRIEPLQTRDDQYETNIVELQNLEEDSHNQVVNAERQYTQLQLELSRREDQLDHLRERIEDDFGLVAYDYVQQIDGPTPLPFGEKMIQSLPKADVVPETSEADIKQLKGQMRRIGSVSPEAQQEFYQVKERYEFLSNQIADLEKASEDLSEVIETLDGLMSRDFIKTFKSVDQEFSNYFSRLFNGGEAKLMFSDETNPVEGGVDIEVRLPGRRHQGLAVLSGGERSLTAVALIFALLKVSPTPFCILDEVDAMLDESNVGRFIDLLKELSRKTQFVVITHNRNTVQAADVIYGVTMGRDSTSKMISLKLEDVDEKYLE